MFKAFIRKELVFCIAFCAALVSAFFVHPSAAYAGYIDTHVLFVLFSLMTVVAGLRSCGVFDFCADFLCRAVKSLRSLCAVLVFLCFFFSMFITNDVSLLTFVPFTIMLLVQCGAGRYVMYTVVLQTLAANLGSMLTPMGNPQNLFLYTRMGTGVLPFCSILLPYVLFSAVLLALSLLAVPRTPVVQKSGVCRERGTAASRVNLVIFLLLFVLSICCVIKLVPAWLCALVTALTVLIIQRSLLKQVDYMLLLTFCAFFVFTGNISAIPSVKTFLEGAVQGNEFAAALAASQIISNVPAALLLYPFSSSLKQLLLGVDIGGLGTLVASLASLISWKLYVNTSSGEKTQGLEIRGGTYFVLFTAMNVLYLVLLCGLHAVLGSLA